MEESGKNRWWMSEIYPFSSDFSTFHIKYIQDYSGVLRDVLIFFIGIRIWSKCPDTCPDSLYYLLFLRCMDNKEEKVIISGWIARDDYVFKYDSLNLFIEKPERDGNGGWRSSATHIPLPRMKFRDLAWTDEPVKVDIIIKKN